MGCGHIFHYECIYKQRLSNEHDGIDVNLQWNSGDDADTYTKYPVYKCLECSFTKFQYQDDHGRWTWRGRNDAEKRKNRNKIWKIPPKPPDEMGELIMTEPKRFKVEIVENKNEKKNKKRMTKITNSTGVLDELFKFKKLKLKF